MNRTVMALVAALALAPLSASADDAMTAPINAPKDQSKDQSKDRAPGSDAPVVEIKPQAAPEAAAPKTAPGAPKPGAVSMDDLAIPSPLGDMALGSLDAPVTVVEYASMTCSHCAAFDKENLARLKELVEAGKVRYVFREFPLDLKAFGASLLVRCVARSDAPRFFDLVDRLFRAQEEWMGNNTLDWFKAFARKEGIEEKAFESCYDDVSANGIKRTQQVAVEKLGVNSTPTFFVNGVPVKGNAWPLLDKAIKDAIADRS